MASTKKVLTSLHGRRVGIDAASNLIINGRTIPSQNDTGALKIIQITPNAVDATATLTAAQLLAGVITSTTAAAVNGTLPTGTLLDAADSLAIDDAFEWVVINTGAANAFTILAGATHTIVGNPAVALSSSGRFLTRKTATGTFITYRI
jgi:hypothetical protein